MLLDNAEFIITAARAEDFPSDGLMHIVFAGRSNSGKSSVINSLLSRKSLARTSSTPGKTANINFYLINGRYYFSDLPGYGFARVSKVEKARWDRLIDDYFRETEKIALALLLVDIRHEPTMEDLLMANYLKTNDIDFIVIANKADKIKPGTIDSRVADICSKIGIPHVIAYSTKTNLGKDAAIREIIRRIED